MVCVTSSRLCIELFRRWLSWLTMLLRFFALNFVVWRFRWSVRKNVCYDVPILSLVVCSSNSWIWSINIRQVKGSINRIVSNINLVIICWLPFWIKFVYWVINVPCHHRWFRLFERMAIIWYMLVWDVSYWLKEMLRCCSSWR